MKIVICVTDDYADRLKNMALLTGLVALQFLTLLAEEKTINAFKYLN